jgi:hypothetical protein
LFVDPHFSLLCKLRTGNPAFVRAGAPPPAPLEHALPPMLVFGFEVESRMLVQAGPRRSPFDHHLTIDSPPCMHGDECVGVTQQIAGLAQGHGIVLMARMTPEELEHHERTGDVPMRFRSLTDPPPATYRPTACVLCDRFHFTELLLGLALTTRRPIGPELLKQWYCNTVDCPDGYSAPYCFTPGADTPGLIGPIAMFAHDALFAEQGRDGRWRINQDRMKAVPAPDETKGPRLPTADFPYGSFINSVSTPPLPQERDAENVRQSLCYLEQLFQRAAASAPPSTVGCCESNRVPTASEPPRRIPPQPRPPPPRQPSVPPPPKTL